MRGKNINRADPDETVRYIWICTVCKGVWFNLQGWKGEGIGCLNCVVHRIALNELSVKQKILTFSPFSTKIYVVYAD